MKTMELPGLERLMATCQRLGLTVLTEPPGRAPTPPGMLIQGHPFDPMLSAVYSRWGQASFATDVAGVVLARCDDNVNELIRDNVQWSEGRLKPLSLKLFAFGGTPGMGYSYATVPSLADTQGCQPVVEVDTYEVPSALPIASSVDRFFDTYAHYLEALCAIPGFRKEGEAALTFPWEIPQFIGRDERLVELIRAGAFNALMRETDENRDWVERVLVNAASRT